MSVLNENQLLGASGAGGDYEIEQSLRFDEGRETRLTRTPTTNGNAKTWTWSAWVKRSELSNSAQSTLFAAGVYNGSSTHLHFASDNTLHFYQYDSSYIFREESTAVFRDTSAWYHIVAVVDTTNGTAADRIRLYVNGVQITSFANVLNPNQNQNTFMNLTANKNYIGDFDRSGDGDEFGGYLGEINFIDGQALTPDSFGETGKYGEWKPIEYAGTYGTNGFYLPFEQDYSVEGFSTVVYEGTGAAQYVGGTGFKPDFIWGKSRGESRNHYLFDAVRGANNYLSSNTTGAAADHTQIQTSFDNDGFTVGTSTALNRDGYDHVAWCWDMGGTTASNTSGTINSSVRANQAYGQSIVTYTGTGSNATVGHGLSYAPNMSFIKPRNFADNWIVTYDAVDGSDDQAYLNLTNAGASPAAQYAVAQNATTLGLTAWNNVNDANDTYVAYCFHDVTGYSKFSSYEGTGGTHAITLGFSPAFVMIKNVDATGNWTMWDNTRNPNNPVTQMLRANTSGAEETKTDREPSFTATGFTIGDSDADTNASGQTYIYMAFADTREYAYWYDQSGNNNDWTSEGGLTESDVMVDSPTNNFATLNPLSSFTGYATAVLSEGNLQASLPDNAEGKGSISVSSGKWYFEGFAKTATNNKLAFGIHKADGIFTGGTSIPNNSSAGLVWFGHSGIQGYASDSSYGTFTTGDIIGVKLDMDSKTIQFTKNGTAQGTKDFSSANFDTVVASVFSGQTSNVGVLNFGSDSSFAGNKTPQGNQDANGIGDFYYAPPTVFLALCTANLPSVDVIPTDNFNTVLYTGNGSTQSITGVGFQPDFVWWKSRSGSNSHVQNDSVRGVEKMLRSNLTNAESSGDLTAFQSDGFSVRNTVDNGNYNNETYVAWNWKAGGSASSNSNGTITSQVSANVDAGFSIVTYTGSGSAGTVGTGLSQRADLIITKGRSDSGNWVTWHKDLPSAFASNGGYAYLNSTGAAGATTVFYDGTGFTSSVFKWRGGNENVNQSSRTYLSYCFHSVESYSKIGKYVGNGNANGPMVNCGFFPNFVMIRRTDSGSHWEIHDIAREPNNVKTKLLNADQSNAEDNNANSSVDFISNGFKLRTAHAERNASGGTYIYAAFAESPFKNSNAR